MGFATDLLSALRRHWPHYLVEAGGLAAFVSLSSATSVVFHHPSSAVARALGPSEMVQRTGLALVVGGLIMAMAYSPWGKRSGSHFNPAITLAFWKLGHIRTADAVWYVLAQFAGGLAAAFAVFKLLDPWFGYPAVHYNTTRPPNVAFGWAWALLAEMVISAVFLLVLLYALHSARLKAWVGALAGALLALFIVFESPISGMSLNPARSLATATAAGLSPALWVYLVGPLAAMWAAAVWFGRYRERQHLSERPPVYPDATA